MAADDVIDEQAMSPIGPGCVRRALYRRQSYRDVDFAITERQSAQNRLSDRPRRSLGVCRL